MYQLVFRGQCVAGVAPETARANVAQVFKASQAQIDRMFSGERVVIRNKLDNEAAAKFQAALAKQGIVVDIEAMSAPGTAETPASGGAAKQAAPAPEQSSNPATADRRAAPEAEPGERLPVAGDRVDELLAGSSLTLGRPGETLGQPRRHEAPVFHELGQWSLAPPGERLAEPSGKTAVTVPDTSHLTILPPGESG